MEELSDLMNNLKISNIKKQTIIPEYIINWIHNDIEYMFHQIVSYDKTIKTFELFNNLNMYSSLEIEIIYNYLIKNGYRILEKRVKESKLYYDEKDIHTYMDYYLEQLYEQMCFMKGC